MITRLDRHLGSTILGYSAMVLAVLLTLTSLFTFISQQDDIGTGTYDVRAAFLYTLLSMPQQVFELFPISALIGGILGLGALARDSELTVMRAAGVSPLRLGGAAAMAGTVVLGVMWVVGEYVAPPADHYGRQLKVFSKFSEFNAAGSRSSWSKDGPLMVNIRQQTAGNLFGGMYLFELGPDREIRRIVRADRAADLGGSTWRLENFAETRFEEDRTEAERAPSREIQASLNRDFVGLAVVSPDALPVRGLRDYVRHLRANGLESQAYEVAMWSRIARTASAVLVCLLAVPFALGPLRSSGAGARTVAGILLGVLYFLVNRTMENSAQVYDLDPMVAAWTPTALLAMVTAVAYARLR
jgi:lipopolysaccharide export system permease protein